MLISACDPNGMPVHPWPWLSLPFRYGEIDYVFVSEAYVQGRSATAQLPWTGLSDHRMVAAVVRAG